MTYKGYGSETRKAGDELGAAQEEDGENIQALPGATAVLDHNRGNDSAHALHNGTTTKRKGQRKEYEKNWSAEIYRRSQGLQRFWTITVATIPLMPRTTKRKHKKRVNESRSTQGPAMIVLVASRDAKILHKVKGTRAVESLASVGERITDLSIC